jgi:hypothetical protein
LGLGRWVALGVELLAVKTACCIGTGLELKQQAASSIGTGAASSTGTGSCWLYFLVIFTNIPPKKYHAWQGRW